MKVIDLEQGEDGTYTPIGEKRNKEKPLPKKRKKRKQENFSQLTHLLDGLEVGLGLCKRFSKILQEYEGG